MLLSDRAGPTLAGILTVSSRLTHSIVPLCTIFMASGRPVFESRLCHKVSVPAWEVTLFLQTYFMILWWEFNEAVLAKVLGQRLDSKSQYYSQCFMMTCLAVEEWKTQWSESWESRSIKQLVLLSFSSLSRPTLPAPTSCSSLGYSDTTMSLLFAFWKRKSSPSFTWQQTQ